MTSAVAFVFGLCALSFAAGCVVTAIMLRTPEPADETASAPEPTAPKPAPPLEQREPQEPEVRLPTEEPVTRPIHRNPVMGLPILPGQPAPPADSGEFNPVDAANRRPTR